MLAVKKLITAFLIPPGLIIIILMILALWQVRSRRWKQGGAVFLAAVLLWLSAMAPVADLLMGGLERDFPIPSKPSGDVIILLGGGVRQDVADLTGKGSPSSDMLARVVTAVRLQKRLHLPILISGGALFEQKTPEAAIVKRFLVDLGVPDEQVLMEDRSRDTVENAIFSSRICAEHGFKRPLLVTSAYHMRRSVVAFGKQGMAVQPVPAAFQVEPGKKSHWLRYMPSADNLLQTATAFKEHIGLLYYYLAL